jgi:mannose-6-phosphate isomerase-like protein (cupin superfamily)
MKKLVPVLGAAALLVMALAFGQVQTKLTVEPDPSFAEDAVSNHRYPGLDTDVFLYINHWRNSVPY